MNLDLLGAAICGWISVCCFSLYAFTNPKHDRWMNMPDYVRRGLAICGATFCWRSVNLLCLPPDISTAGHINAEGIMVSLSLAYTITAMALWAGVFKRLPVGGWSRLHYAEQQEREGRVPVMLQPHDVIEMAHDRGMTVNAEPPPARRRINGRASLPR